MPTEAAPQTEVTRGGGGAIALKPTPSPLQFWRRRGFTSSGKLLAKKLRVGEGAEVSKGTGLTV